MYFRSNYWSGIVTALHAGSYDLAREQLLLVCHRNKATSARDTRQEQYYRRLYYDDKHDLQTALNQSGPNLQDREMALRVGQNIVHDTVEERHDRPDPAPWGQESTQVRENIVNGAVEERHDQPDPTSLDPESTQENIQLHEIEEELQNYIDSSSQNTPAVSLTEEEQKAGSVIRNAYREYFRRKISLTKSSARLRSNSYMEYLKQSQTVEWARRSHYRLLYLGALPNLLACLECVWADIIDQRADARKRLKNGLGPENVDRENATLTKLS
ncbi:hypothetical protein AX14_008242 [Amanita brunnescens Koide BX004]|nr:hypothetical protein AX14_008242 [Amanita brunnescens Koide BX004]